MKVIGEDARPVADSFWNYQHLRPEIGQKRNGTWDLSSERLGRFLRGGGRKKNRCSRRLSAKAGRFWPAMKAVWIKEPAIFCAAIMDLSPWGFFGKGYSWLKTRYSKQAGSETSAYFWKFKGYFRRSQPGKLPSSSFRPRKPSKKARAPSPQLPVMSY